MAGSIVPGSQRRSDDDLSRLSLVAHVLRQVTDPAEIVDIAVRQGMAALDADGGVLALVDGDVLRPIALLGYAQNIVAGVGPLRIERQLPLTAAVRDGEPVWVPSREDGYARFPELPALATQSQAWAAIPLVIRGSIIGVLGVSFLRPRPFSDDERMFILALADLGALALASCEYEQPRRRRELSPPDDGIAVWLDRAINDVFSARLSLVGLERNRRLDEWEQERLDAAAAALDEAVAACRSIAMSVLAPGSPDAT